ncbi:HvfC/BufC N-terminal domain-containing protein [Sphingomonas sp. PR090111-T3T-6A]|uniref:HvfC/BufC N-terminal domain-containing protein n=1 Tax=Sphingomonas sp. PR090111-T3T-6A TaxID=685778 RepID=UPI000380D37B|nr:DNA-binding domain-containing protein [Sphingomonas sp. PR090111-T3T-6A]
MSLLALQRDFRGWLATEDAGVAARFGEPAQAGLAVYLNNYRGQLMACLSESFETVRAWIGDNAFEGAAALHIDRLPPHSWTLDAYALDFPETLDRLYPEDPEVGELGRLERALGLAFVGPDAAPIEPASLDGIDWDRAVLRLVPTFASFSAATNAGAIWSALSGGAQPPAASLLPQPASIMVWRAGFAPAFRTLEAAEAEALALVAEGRDFGALCASLVARFGEEQGPALAGGFLGQWLADGLIASVS